MVEKCSSPIVRLSIRSLVLLTLVLLALVLLALPFTTIVLASPLHAERRGNGSEKGEKFSGQVMIAPASEVGSWVILLDDGNLRTVQTIATTRLDHGVLPEGSWVRVEATLTNTDTWLASRLRRDYIVADEVVVRVQPGAVAEIVAGRYGMVVQSTLLASGNIYLLHALDGDVEELADLIALDPEVIWAEANFISGVPEGHPFRIWHWGGIDPSSYMNQLAYSQINLGSLAQSYQGAGIEIAILDTGIDLQHPAFAGRLVDGWDMVADDAIPQDEGFGLAWGHGTHVAGTVAQVAPQSKLMPLRVLDTNGRGNTFTLAYAVGWAADHGADVLNLSLGSLNDSHLLRDTIKEVSERGVIVVAASGNSNSAKEHFPAADSIVIAVSAIDSQNRKAEFANYGDWVDVSAPGVGITSTMIQAQGAGYAGWSGTSMATPFVSGAAALLRQQNPTASASTIEQHFITLGRDLDAFNPLYVQKLGHLLDIEALLATPVKADLKTTAPLGVLSVHQTARVGGAGIETVDKDGGQSLQLYLPFVRK